MQAGEQFTLTGIGEQEYGKFLGENVIGTNGIPWFGRQFILGMARWRDMPKMTFVHWHDFVIIVKDYPAITGNTKVLGQQIARK